MKNTHHQSAALSNPTPTPISSQHANYLLFFLDNRCEIAAMKKQFALTPLQVIEFLTSKSVRAAIQEIHETICASLAVAALKARDFAMDKLKTVCLDLVRQTTIPATGPINESTHAKAINYLRLATTQLGRFAAAAIAPPKTPRPSPAESHAEHLLPNALNSLSTLSNPYLVAKTPLAPAAHDFDSTNFLGSINPTSLGQSPVPQVKEQFAPA